MDWLISYKMMKTKTKLSSPATPINSPNPHVKEVKSIEVDCDAKMHDVDEMMKKSLLNAIKDPDVAIDLDENPNASKRAKKDPTAHCLVLKDVKVNQDTHIRLIALVDGYYIDIRKFFRGYPSGKYILIPAVKFGIASDLLRPEIEKIAPFKTRYEQEIFK